MFSNCAFIAAVPLAPMLKHRQHARLVDLIGRSSTAFLITDPDLPDNPIVAVNAAFCRLTGYSAEQAQGRNCRLLQGLASNEGAVAQLRDAVSRAAPASVSVINYRADGLPFLNAVTVSPIHDEAGALAFFLGSQVDVSAFPADRRARADAMVAALPGRLRQVLALMAQGLVDKAIARALGLSLSTVRMHRARLLARLGIGTAEAIRLAVEAGL
jgi:PAS domain S-box-containing protein